MINSGDPLLAFSRLELVPWSESTCACDADARTPVRCTGAELRRMVQARMLLSQIKWIPRLGAKFCALPVVKLASRRLFVRSPRPPACRAESADQAQCFGPFSAREEYSGFQTGCR